MNERIKELALQYGGKTGNSVLVNAELFEKFAELIVRECADMAESFQRHQYDFTGDLELHEFMKKHFGVEE